ncbi:TPA: tRNA (guanosine(37)-N1)-methyltransferase TrmD [Candidatus Nomurabacteria bacterium]|uniref:tRNA (guanine-N(1)-)-methyltransferase n=2 Tax=Candidatus Nomuraibacteriota TaxID=1752729 RepID=A0A1F6YNL9_9BACT|nr:MAG: tRNA (guanosine(37)-N1)-methyltransferase TrmD [Candidatus Nomurabacteria bacterium RIFOXYB1_FULL_43_14]OGJ07839.1 MAG: tRNA (guanosine(37)-N1)-methyltransferase TrmD [Candidatus Nomurabacteria bacterium RIFOXYA1_FULL_42_12]OGJ07918.1 MAG: tRNA (guanosine(37)-N1)-methyltransferase TrmD [Candidatus Nomurabacteria bacterium RIFOXYA2_FULL_42_12]OGJ10187.1 MAG: tRNA (guanosine(37)-N1)-methyltransferase TrmD [Candidatus Nomurabacteria bacterium RIFOXYC2_FULL_43_16]OGJ14186.1 MAG: tRNA (guano
MTKFHIITIFPEMFNSYLKESIIGRAIYYKKIKVLFYNPMDFCEPKRRVDDRPYGGGPGMVLRPELFLKAFAKIKIPSPGRGKKNKTKVILFSPSGKKFNTAYAKKLVKQKYTDIILISGRYEGIDARMQKILKAEEISIGDYVLTGGELPAMVLIDSISRQIPGVLGKYESLEEERVSSSEVYTRPEVFKYRGKNYKVPKVLLSGNHKKIEEWKKSKGRP